MTTSEEPMSRLERLRERVQDCAETENYPYLLEITLDEARDLLAVVEAGIALNQAHERRHNSALWIPGKDPADAGKALKQAHVQHAAALEKWS